MALPINVVCTPGCHCFALFKSNKSEQQVEQGTQGVLSARIVVADASFKTFFLLPLLLSGI